MSSRAVSFAGNYTSWETASADATGYDSGEILNRIAAATRRVVAGDAPYERDSVLFDHIEYSWPVLCCLLQVACERSSLRVVDFGGSLGTAWRQNQVFLSRLSVPVRWTVVEQDNFVSLGRREFSNDTLHFESTIADAGTGGVDVILFGCSLCYVRDPVLILREALSTAARYIVVDRIPVISGNRDRIALQTVREPIYDATYPIRLFGEDALHSRLLRDWRLIEKWESELQPDPSAKYYGFFMERQ